MLSIRPALENTLVAYLEMCAAGYPQCAALTVGTDWAVQPMEGRPPVGKPRPRPIVAGHRAWVVPLPTNLVIVADEADAELSDAAIYCVKVKFRMTDPGCPEGLEAQQNTTLAILACIPLLSNGGADMALACQAINAFPGAQCAISSFRPAKPLDRSGVSEDGRHFQSELCFEFYASTGQGPAGV